MVVLFGVRTFHYYFIFLNSLFFNVMLKLLNDIY